MMAVALAMPCLVVARLLGLLAEEEVALAAEEGPG